MSVAGLDPRLNLARDGVAARALEGRVAADRYVDPEPTTVCIASAGLRVGPDPSAEQADQLLFGEWFDVLERAGEWSFGQALRDGYVGWVPSAALRDGALRPTHRVRALRTFAFAEPSIKRRPEGPFSLNALVRVAAREGRFAEVEGAGWVVEAHLAPVGEFESDPAAVAEQYLGAPYLWGGRDSLGLDCSGLVQQALYACGRACPRDSDQQAALGSALKREALARNDLVFWRAHVGMMLDADRLLHANAHHMAVAIESLDQAIARIEQAGGGPPSAFRRL